MRPFHAGCGRPGRGHPHPHHHAHWSPGGPGDDPMGHGPDDLDGGFGVRRPLRFLAHKLDLSDAQVGEFARILDELKTERAQAAVDGRRSLAEFADAVAGEAFDAAKAQAADRLRAAVLTALGRIHAALTPDQRGRFAYLIRAGALTV